MPLAAAGIKLKSQSLESLLPQKNRLLSPPDSRFRFLYYYLSPNSAIKDLIFVSKIASVSSNLSAEANGSLTLK